MGLDSGGSLCCWLLWALWSLIYAGIHVRCIENLSSWERPGISFLKFQHSRWRINVILEMFSFLLLSRRQLIATNVFWITIIIFQSCQPLPVKVGSWDYGHTLWRLELQFRKQILHSALGLAPAKVWSPQGVAKKFLNKVYVPCFVQSLHWVDQQFSRRGNMLIYSAIVRDRAHLILFRTFFWDTLFK